MVTLSHISKTYGNLTVYEDFNLTLESSRITTILGPSGYGKSTLLNLISGLVIPDKGKVEKPVNQRLGYMLQENILFPWRTLKENILLAVELADIQFNVFEDDVNNMLKAFELSAFADYYPDMLSGGMRQRASLIRSLIIKPDLLLLDEPFSSLDYDVKLKNQKYLVDYQAKSSATVIIVTHDIEDAIALSHEVLIVSGRPAILKKRITIHLDQQSNDPVLSRSSKNFPDYFREIWESLKQEPDEN